MLLTISTTAAPSTDLGFLLHRHPGKAQTFGVSVGGAPPYGELLRAGDPRRCGR